MNRLQRYEVTLTDGRKVTGYVHTVQTGGIHIVDVFSRLHRRLEPHITPYNTKTPAAHMTVGMHKFIGRYTNPISIEPVGAPAVRETLHYALKKTGTWWQNVIVDYIELEDE